MTSLLFCLPLAVAVPQFARPFAPHEGVVAPPERAQRAEVCLNGLWQFQPLPTPPGWRRGESPTPDLPAPDAGRWDPTPIRIPSPWNVNRWGPGRRGRDVGPGTAHPFDPDSECYPSYPRAWDDSLLGWLRRSFQVPAEWGNRRVVLHFEAVAGAFEVRVNGVRCGSHFDSHLPAEFDVTDLVRRAGDNELLVSVRHPCLFDRHSAQHDKYAATYPPGSNTDNLAGIWQDVYLLGLPAVRVIDAFVQPDVAADRLTVVAELRNDTGAEQTVELAGEVRAWHNDAGTDTLSAPEPRWHLAETVLNLSPNSVRVPSGGMAKVSLTVAPGGRLRPWTPASPQLYGLLLTATADRTLFDTKFERFGWRQVTLAGREVRLNGAPLQMVGDFCHPFGVFMMSRRFVWAWYKLLKDCGANAVRPHAQPYPRYYLDLADELGILVLDETAAFGSSIRLNPEAPEFWQRYGEHFDALIRRDRNHPSVFGWSFGNEMFAIPLLNKLSEADRADYYARLKAIGARAAALDPTRAWLSCDGDEDLGGALPIWSKHHGHDVPSLPVVDKPQMLGESGGTYYARPAQLAMFNHDRAYADYRGRNEALAIDLYANLTRLARPRLALFSPSELVWFGLEPLPLGFAPGERAPTLDDGVRFGPFVEGRPGMQPERLAPYSGTLNPGWDPALPLYRPLAMCEAMRAALAPRGPQPCAWDHRAPAEARPAPPTPTVATARLLGRTDGAVSRRFAALGVRWADDSEFVLVDASTAEPVAARAALAQARTALVVAGDADEAGLSSLVGAPVRLTERPTTLLLPDGAHPWTASFGLPQLYFAEDGANRFIARHGLAGAWVDGARVLLRAAETDWSLFNDRPENAKCGATMLYEQLHKPAGAVLAVRDRVALCTLDPRLASRGADALWRGLLSNAGLVLGQGTAGLTPAFDDHGVLLNALGLGRFATDKAPAVTVVPRGGEALGGQTWAPVECPSRDRFVCGQWRQTGPASDFTVYLSAWLRSPRALDDLLVGGPDVPRVTLLCYAADKLTLTLNGAAVMPARTEPADYRTLSVYEPLPLRQGWNHLLWRLDARQLGGATPGTLAVRLLSSSREWSSQVESAVDRPAAP